MQIFLTEKIFWKTVLERLIGIVIFVAERNFAFGGFWSNETFDLLPYGNIVRLFELLAKKNIVLNELQNKIIWHIRRNTI